MLHVTASDTESESRSKKSDCSQDFVDAVGLVSKHDLALCPKQSEYVTSDYQEEDRVVEVVPAEAQNPEQKQLFMQE